jgi:hypothetical protein
MRGQTYISTGKYILGDRTSKTLKFSEPVYKNNPSMTCGNYLEVKANNN